MSSPWDSNQVVFLCRHCGVHSVSEALATELWFDEEDHVEYRYRLARCSACHDISLLIAMVLGWNNEQKVYDTEVALYPAPPRRLGAAVPESLQKCFDEVRACYHARAFTAAAIMCRRALELLAAARGAQERNLARSIEKLRDQGDIDQRLYDWCTTLRFAGNTAAHEVGPGVSQLDAKDMSDLVEAIIDYVFVFQERYEQFKKRRESDKAYDWS